MARTIVRPEAMSHMPIKNMLNQIQNKKVFIALSLFCVLVSSDPSIYLAIFLSP